MSTSLPTKTVKTTCCYCGVGCGVRVTRNTKGLLSLEGDVDHPVNRGQLCSKGRSLHHVAMDLSDRILYPRMRATRDAEIEPVSMDLALNHVANEFTRIIEEHGPEAVGFYVSGQCLTEEYYIANKLMKGFVGSNNIDTNSRLCMSSAVVGYKKTVGEDAVPVCYDDIEACHCFLVTGANPAWCHPILWKRVLARLDQEPTAKLIVVDPRKTDSCAQADLHLQIRPGTDVTLHNVIAALLIQQGDIDAAFLRDHCDGFQELKQSLKDYDVGHAARVCGVPESDIRLAAAWIGASPTFLSMWTMGLNQSSVGTDKNLSLINLNLLRGAIGRPGSGPFSLTGQPNAMGGREVGGLSTLLAAHLDLASEADRKQVAEFWGVDTISPTPGLTATEMMTALQDGKLKAIWIICTNPAVSLPNLAEFEAAMASAELVVVQEISERSDTVAYADVVLPAAGWLEKSGTMTNSERRISKVEALLDPPGEACPDVDILCRFAAKMGWADAFSYKDVADIYDEYTEMTRGGSIDITGVSHERLEREGSLQWPCPSPSHPGTARLFTDGKFLTLNQRAQLHVVEEIATLALNANYPFVLTTGRIRDQWHTRTKTGKVSKLNRQFENPFVEVHPDDARTLGISDGQTVELTSRQGEAVVNCLITDRIRPGVLFMPMHWGKSLNGVLGRANNLSSSRVDPVSKEPDYKFIAVRLRPSSPSRKKVVIVGAGAAALQFIQTYREHNKMDQLVLFGREPRGFYNRILLPDYINKERTWDGLMTLDLDAIAALDVDFRVGVEVTSLDREGQCVGFDGGEESYDRLVLCTGSRPFVPPGIPMERGGMHTLRTREDAEEILAGLHENVRILIVGGGLLGIEMAAALDHAGIQCSIVNAGPWLMSNQLDQDAGSILEEEIKERGISVFCDDIIETYEGQSRVKSVVTKSGFRIDCDLVIVAVGTRPNIDVFVPAGLEANRGLVVDGQLKTNDPAIYALGEIAEFKGKLCGITAAAQAQARVAAMHCAGNPWALYRGSVPFNILKIHGRDVASAGLASAPDNDEAYEEISFMDRRRRVYKKCIIYRDRLVGCTLIGDNLQFAAYRDLIQDQTELDDRRDTLLREGGVVHEAPIGKIICSCNQVGEGNLRAAIESGIADLDLLCAKTRAGTGCGSCRPELQLLLAEYAVEPVQATA